MAEYEVKHVGYFPTVCFRHITGFVKEPEHILLLKAARTKKDTFEKEIPGVPFMKVTSYMGKDITLNFIARFKKGKKFRHGLFPMKDVVNCLDKIKVEEVKRKYNEWNMPKIRLTDRSAGDMVVREMKIMSFDENLYDMFRDEDVVPGIQKAVKYKKPEWESMVLTLQAVSQKDIPEWLEIKIEEAMGDEMNDYKFKLATFDLVGLETFNHWTMGMGKNLLPQGRTDAIKLAMHSVFNEWDNSLIRQYVKKAKVGWVLVEPEKVEIRTIFKI